MKSAFVRRQEGNDSLILIFAGWSVSDLLYSDIELTGWDVLVVYGYDDAEFDLSLLNGYSTIYLYAWSLGVCVAANVLNSKKITRAFAINGTESPVDDSAGIPERVYHATADNLDERNLRKFQRRMFASSSDYKAMADRLAPRCGIEELRRQLYAVERIAEKGGRFPWRSAYISEEDAIFPPESQRHAWMSRGDVEIKALSPGHYADIREIIRNTLPDPQIIGQRFQTASGNYDRYATAQRKIAERLASGLAEYAGDTRLDSILEIGQGTGMFTRSYSPLLKPDRITFVDIYSTQQMSVAEEEEYIVADAEKWLRRSGRKWDAIVSASAVQWFADPQRFVAEAYRCLSEEGILAISTFAEGNLAELDSVRQSPIIYASAEEWQEWLAEDFMDIRMESDTLTLEFAGARELLLHLHNTGVGGSGSGVQTKGKRGLALPHFREIKTLTYRPLYIFARKR